MLRRIVAFGSMLLCAYLGVLFLFANIRIGKYSVADILAQREVTGRGYSDRRFRGDVKKLVETCISDSWSCSRFTP